MHRRESAKGDTTAPRWTVDELLSTRPQRDRARRVGERALHGVLPQ